MKEFIQPTLVDVDSSTLTDAQVTSWREQGFVLVDGLLPVELIRDVAQAATSRFPDPDSDEAQRLNDFGSGMTFPDQDAGFNRLSLHPHLLEASSRLLEVPISELRLSQSDLWPKYGRVPGDRGDFDNQDQRMHLDYPNHTLTHPAAWNKPEAVEIIVYLCDETEVGGATAVVPRQGSDDTAYSSPMVNTPGVSDIPWINDRKRAEAWFMQNRPAVAEFRRELYEREVYAKYREGSVLLYRHDTWHRGTSLLPGALRLAQNLTFRRANASWISTLHPGWAWAMYKPDQRMERLIAETTPEARSVLGFPAPGDSYWDSAKIDAVEARYGALGFDATPYREQLSWTGLY
jgi:ectoine hydroxylase-related dioxygenase (phytanoyl-CoA dioxygenase family)